MWARLPRARCPDLRGTAVDWQQLVEVCRVVDTVLIDQETVYAPRLSNDRLLLGLKGSLNEYELDLLRQRSVEARVEKARRGELVSAAPIGYSKQRTRSWRRIRISAYSKRSNWFLVNSRNWEPCAKRCCGSWSTVFRCPRKRPTDTFCGGPGISSDVPDAHSPDIRRGLCIWKNGTGAPLRKRGSTPWLPP